MKLIKTENAVGHVICHDITQIIPGVTKDARFHKGHVVTQEDIPVLLSMGKEHLYVWEMKEGIVHEDDAALRLLKLCMNDNMSPTQVKEGKVELRADIDGLFLVDERRLMAVNMCDELMIATRHGNIAVKKGEKLAGMRVIPLVIEEEKLAAAEKAAGFEPLIRLLPWKLKTAGLIVTGSEVYKRRIEDKFGPVVEKKLAQFGISVVKRALCDDNTDMIAEAINEMRRAGVDLIACTGGMSVDPDDRTPGAIRKSGAEIISYGAPVLPGAMLLVGYYEDGTPVLGLPGCVMYAKATVFDLILPRVAAGVPITKQDIAALGHGGLCQSCEQCLYPHCPFGK
ncbi:MAG: molybdopterin-binding protein [Oscillospiraceae bacterium]